CKGNGCLVYITNNTIIAMSSMFFWQTPIPIYVTPSGVEIFLLDKKQKISVAFPEKAVQHLEVLNQEMVVTAFTEALKPLGSTKQNIVLLLAPEIIFNKEFALNAEKDISAAETEFKNLLPFADNGTLIIQVPSAKNTTFMATSRSLI